MNIKAVVSSAVIGATSLFTGVEAQAASYYCYNTSSAHVCVYNVSGDRYNKTYSMEVNGQYAGRHSVYCNPAHRYNYNRNANGIVCFEFE